MITLDKARERLINIVNGYFDSLEQKYSDRLKDFNRKGVDL